MRGITNNKQIDILIKDAERLKTKKRDSSEYDLWEKRVKRFIQKNGDNELIKEFDSCFSGVTALDAPASFYNKEHVQTIDRIKNVLIVLEEDLENKKLPNQNGKTKDATISEIKTIKKKAENTINRIRETDMLHVYTRDIAKRTLDSANMLAQQITTLTKNTDYLPNLEYATTTPVEVGDSILMITTAIDLFEDISNDCDETLISLTQTQNISKPVEIYDSLHIHKSIQNVSRQLFVDGHYKQAVLDSCIELEDSVKTKSGCNSKSGKKLMGAVFNKDAPLLRISDLKTQIDKDEQEGFMHLCMGAMQCIRNPKAHKNIVQNDPYPTLKYISFVSLLMNILDSAIVCKKQ